MLVKVKLWNITIVWVRLGVKKAKWYVILVGKKPPTRWCKLNTDGASFGNPSKAGGRRIIRDSEGRWMRGFARSIGFTTSITAKFWTLRDGLL